MKKAISLLLILALTAASLASCSGEDVKEAAENAADAVKDAAETVGEAVKDAAGEAVESAGEALEAVETAAGEAVAAPAEEEAPAEEAPAAESVSQSGQLIEQMDEWHYLTHHCVFIDGEGVVAGSAAGDRHYEEDEMAEFIAANPEWYKDTALMGAWDTADAPFGDCINQGLAADTDFVNDKDNVNGLMVYKTFVVDSLAENDLYELYCFYDNTFYLYVNGEPYFINDGGYVNSDWNGGYDLIECNQADGKTLKDFLHEGENYIAASIKNAWGGREFDLNIDYELGSTKKSLTYIDRNADWHYTVYACPYTDGEGTIDGGASGGFYDEATDEMAKYIADNPNFMTDTATMNGWETATASFGSCAEAIGWTGSNHGLILYKTFDCNKADLEGVDDMIWFGDYDNTIHVWLNGVEIYTDDGECVIQDWQSNGEWYLDNEQVLNALVDGENYIVVTIKDAWGGRDFNCGFKAFWN